MFTSLALSSGALATSSTGPSTIVAVAVLFVIDSAFANTPATGVYVIILTLPNIESVTASISTTVPDLLATVIVSPATIVPPDGGVT